MNQHPYTRGMTLPRHERGAMELANGVRFDDAQKTYALQHVNPGDADGLESARVDVGFWPHGAEQ